MRKGLGASIRRKCFISYYKGDEAAVIKFVEDFGEVFIPKVIGTGVGDDLIDSENSEYIISKIRTDYISDSTVTICMIGECTHGRRFVDWELKASLKRGLNYPNGLLGILLPDLKSAKLPERFEDNFNRDNDEKSYAFYRYYPKAKEELRQNIEKVFSARTAKEALIINSRDAFKYNRNCSVHNLTH